MTGCFRCGKSLPDLQDISLSDLLEMHEDYRENFPETYKEEAPVRVCQKCFDEMEEDTDEFERSVL